MRHWQVRLAAALSRRLPPFLAYRIHNRYLYTLVGSNVPFRVRALFGDAEIASTMNTFEDVSFALHRTMNFKGMVMAASLLGPGDTVFEVGANLGTETLAFANLVGPTGRVVAVEADPTTAAALRARVTAAALPHVTVVNEAVAAQRGTLHLARAAEHFSGQNYVSDDPAAGEVVVEATTADELVTRFGPPAFVWVDIEGSEYGFLRGASQLLRATRPVMFMEVSGGTMHRSGGTIRAFCALLEELSYAAFDSDTRRLAPIDFGAVRDDVFGDWLLVPRERLDVVPRLRRRLFLARVMPRFRGVSPLEAQYDR
jgi:FkbM family methyltransferase